VNVPAVAEVVARFQRALTDGVVPSAPDAPDAPDADDVVGLLLALHANNLRQWEREDVSRTHHDDDTAVAAAKRDIDTLNAARHRWVEAVDAAIGRAVSQDPAAPPTTESPGMVYDRLSVLTIRIHFTFAAARDDGDAGGRYAVRLPVLRRQLAELEQALDAVFDDVRARRRRFVPYASFKLYGDEGGSASS